MLVALTVAMLSAATPGEAADTKNTAVTASFGFYPIRLYDLAPEKGLFSADFYFWTTLPSTAPPALLEKGPRMEAANGERLDCEVVGYDPPGSIGTKSFWYRCRSRFYHDYTFGLYPFDRQDLEIRLESQDLPEQDLTFKVMPSSHVFDDGKGALHLRKVAFPRVSDWEVRRARIFSDTHRYETNWGFEGYEKLSHYSQAGLQIQLRRNVLVPALSLLGPNLLFVIIAILVAGSGQDPHGRMQALLGVIAGAAAQHYAFMTKATGDAVLRFAHTYFLAAYAVLGLSLWYVIARRDALPLRSQLRWLLAYSMVTGSLLAGHLLYSRGHW